MPVTTLAAAIATTNATTCTVRDVVDFPTSGTFDVVIDSEQITVGSGAGTVGWSSLTRGAQGTTAATHADGAAVYLVEEAYVTTEELLNRMPEATIVGARLMADVLTQASAHIDARCARDFYRHPRISGTEIRYFDGDGSDVLRVRERIISITTLEVGDGTTFETVTAGTFHLMPYNPAPGESYSSIYSETAFPEGRRTVRITGAFGFASVPDIIKVGTIDLARLMVGTVLTASGSSMGGAEYGAVPVPTLLPLNTYRAIEWGKVRVIG